MGESTIRCVFSYWVNENILELDNSDGGTTLKIY